jgi:hypothetical protein
MTDDDLVRFLQTRNAPYCLRCLVHAFPDFNVRSHVDAVQASGAPIVIGDGRCAMCQQHTTVVAWVPGDPDLARLMRR